MELAPAGPAPKRSRYFAQRAVRAEPSVVLSKYFSPYFVQEYAPGERRRWHLDDDSMSAMDAGSTSSCDDGHTSEDDDEGGWFASDEDDEAADDAAGAELPLQWPMPHGAAGDGQPDGAAEGTFCTQPCVQPAAEDESRALLSALRAYLTSVRASTDALADLDSGEWSAHSVTRRAGRSAGTRDVYYVRGPRRFRSRREVAAFLCSPPTGPRDLGAGTSARADAAASVVNVDGGASGADARALLARAHRPRPHHVASAHARLRQGRLGDEGCFGTRGAQLRSLAASACASAAAELTPLDAAADAASAGSMAATALREAGAALRPFGEAVARTGNDAFPSQRDAALSVLAPLEAMAAAGVPSLGVAAASGHALRAVRHDLHRLRINFSCRNRQRASSVRAARDELTALLRRVAAAEARLDPLGAAEARAAAERRRRRSERQRARELRLGVPCVPPGSTDESADGGGSSGSDSEGGHAAGAEGQGGGARHAEPLPPPCSASELRLRCPTFARTRSCEHLCAHLCYYREHEPARQLFELRRRVAEATGSAAPLDGWRATLAVGRPAAAAGAPPRAPRGWHVQFTSPAAAVLCSAAEVLRAVGVDAALAPSWPQASHGGAGVRLTKPQLDRLDLGEQSACLRAALWRAEDETAPGPSELAAAAAPTVAAHMPAAAASARAPEAGQGAHRVSSSESLSGRRSPLRGIQPPEAPAGAGVGAAAWALPCNAALPAVARPPPPADFDGGVARDRRIALAGRADGHARAPPPPRSPFGLLEEILWHDEHKLLVACVLLNVTTRMQVDVVLWRLFAAFPSARALAATLDEPRAARCLRRLLHPLGLQRKRARRLALLSRDWLEARRALARRRDDGHAPLPPPHAEADDDDDPDAHLGAAPLPTETVAALHGVGDYASDAHELFVLGRVCEHQPPRDHALRWYHAWVLQQLT